MAILKEPYEISLWDDVLNPDGKFTEKRLCVIGTDKMQSQNRALEPTLTTNINGQKKFSFQMYKRYTDVVTGEGVENLFYGYLINERKVKLKYKNKWYDFIIKNVSETSTNYLYKYDLEDALVQELSKNGFNVTLDPELMNNLGTAKELAEYVLQDTDWNVESDVFVQTVEESLVYIQIKSNADLSKYNIYKISDPASVDVGITESLLNDDDKVALKGKQLLAFYSSCIDKPHRFQFIYLPNGYAKDKVSRDANRIITEKDCQYYIEINKPDDVTDGYKKNEEKDSGFYLPTGFSVSSYPELGDGTDKAENAVTVSTWYRGTRYGFAQKQTYSPTLDRYVEYYKHGQRTWNSFTNKKINQNGIGNYWEIPISQYYFDNGTQKTIEGYGYNTSFSGSLTITRKADGKPGILPQRIIIRVTGRNNLGAWGIHQYIINENTDKGSNSNWRYFTWNKIPTFGDEYKAEYIRFIPLCSEGSEEEQVHSVNASVINSANISFKLVFVPDANKECRVYGYTQAKFESPVFNQNLASNHVMQGTGGWKAYSDIGRVELRSDFGYFEPTPDTNDSPYLYNFFNSIDILNNNESQENKENKFSKCKNYLWFSYPSSSKGTFLLVNNGPYDNRTLLAPFSPGDEFLLKVNVLAKTAKGEYGLNNNLSETAATRAGTLVEIVADPKSECGYRLATNDEKWYNLTIESYNTTVNKKGYQLVKISSLTEKGKENINSKKQQLRIALQVDNNWGLGGYIRDIEFYKVHRDEQNNIIPPVLNSENDIAVDSGDVEKRHYYFLPEEIEENDVPKVFGKNQSINYLFNTSVRDYTTYKPIYNDNAEKVRQVSVKESNYFNILQAIAEKFECWVTLEVERNDNGGINSKKVCLRRYAGGDNYAAFRYGVNLKDITRVTNSQQIVSKLIVKPNVNEYAEGGVCTIATAGANPTGETAIYDFGYYHNKGLLDAEKYLNTVWKPWSGVMDYVVFRNCTGGLTGENFNNGGNSNSFGPTLSYNTYVNGGGNWKIRNTDNATHFCTDNDGDYNTGIPVKPTGALNDLTGYFPKLKAINNKLLELNEFRNQKQLEYNDAVAKLEVAEARYSAAIESKLELEEKFEGTYSLGIGDLGLYIQQSEVYNAGTTDPNTPNNGQEGCVSYNKLEWVDRVVLVATYGSGPETFESIYSCEYEGQDDYTAYFRVYVYAKDDPKGSTYKDNTLTVTIFPKLKINGKWITVSKQVEVTVKKKEGNYYWGGKDISLNHGLKEDKNVQKLQQEYAQYLAEINTSLTEKTTYGNNKTDLEDLLQIYNARIQGLIDLKTALNKTFFQQYSRFIQEGTWVNEEYIDANKYYADALSTMYNSCYPQVAYTFNVLPISQLPGYEDFNFELGDKTYVEDSEFFGEDENGYPYREQVIISEKVENLDDPSKHSVKVQNFKNQFQDLFQRITATVQQTQYSTGAYVRAAALAEADSKMSKTFLTGTLQNMADQALSLGENSEVVLTSNALTARNRANSSTLKLVGGAILFGKGDAGEEEWKTGLTADGIAADLITAGTIDTARINIMNGVDAAFILNEEGLTGYDYTNSGPNINSFVRFDKYGIYGISGDGTTFLTDFGNATSKSEKLGEIDKYATFALTWDGLKVTGDAGVVARIGKLDGNIINITKNNNKIFSINTNGNLTLTGNIIWEGSNPLDAVLSRENLLDKMELNTTDGIYVEDGYIGIRATAIKTGYLRVGGEDPDGSDAKFYVDIANPIVKIAGWNVTNNSITTGSLGEINSFHMYSGRATDSKSIAGSGNKIDWRLAIGSNFGVDSTGAVYASAGKIGPMDIGQLGEIRKNYVLNSDEPVKKMISHIQGTSTIVHTYNLSEQLSAGTYYLTLKAKTDLSIFCVIRYEDGTYKATDGSGNVFSGGTIQTSTVKLDKKSKTQLEVWVSQSQPNATTEIKIDWIMLETKPFSGWSASPLDPWARPNLLKGSGIKYIATNQYELCHYDFNSSLNSSKNYTLSINAKITDNSSYSTGDRRYYSIRIWRQDKSSTGSSWSAAQIISTISFKNDFNKTVTKMLLDQDALFDGIPSFGSYRLGVYLLYEEKQSDGTWKSVDYPAGETAENRNTRNQVEINWIKLEEGYNNTPWCDETGGTLPVWSSIGNNFSWQFTENEGIIMQNKVDGKMEDVFRVGKKADSSEYGLWMNGYIEAKAKYYHEEESWGGPVGNRNLTYKLDDGGISILSSTDDNKYKKGITLTANNSWSSSIRFFREYDGIQGYGQIYLDDTHGLVLDSGSGVYINSSTTITSPLLVYDDLQIFINGKGWYHFNPDTGTFVET